MLCKFNFKHFYLIVAACTFIIMDHWLQRFRSRAISKNWFIAFPLLTGTVSAYVVTMSRTVNCQNMWMAMEEKHSVLTPAEGNLTEFEKYLHIFASRYSYILLYKEKKKN